MMGKYTKKIIAVLLSLSVLSLNIAFAEEYVNPETTEDILTEENETIFTDTSPTSDEEFFGQYDEESGEWVIEGVINYDYSSDLDEVKNYVMQGGYGMAKKALMEYYRNRISVTRPEIYSQSMPYSDLYLTMRDTYNFSEPLIAETTISGGEYREYIVDLQQTTASGGFMLASLDKGGDVISIISKEGDSEKTPKLRVYYETGTMQEYSVLKDSYTRAFDDEDTTYSTENYGLNSEVEVKGSYYYRESEDKYLPYSRETREGYLVFRAPNTNNVKKAELVFWAKLKPEEGGSELVDESKNLCVFNAYNKTFRESPEDPDTSLPLLTWSTIRHNHYSWNTLPGGWDWQAPDLCASEYQNYNTRMGYLSSLISAYNEGRGEEYLRKGIEIITDFIGDAGAGTPVKREIEGATRAQNVVPAYFYIIDSELASPETSTAILKYLYDEAWFLYDPVANGGVYYVDNNRAVWVQAGLATIANAFPEFKDSTEWLRHNEERMLVTMEKLIAEDGSYVEACFGYPVIVVGYMNEILQSYRWRGEEPPTILLEKIEKLVLYLISCCHPSGTTPNIGSGGRGSIRALAQRMTDLVDSDIVTYWATSGEEGAAPEKTTQTYETLKIVTMRSDWGANGVSLFTRAWAGGSHGTRDVLALDVEAWGTNILTATGVTSYDPAHPHYKFQSESTRSRNTIECDNVGQRGGSSVLDGEINGYGDATVYDCENLVSLLAWTDSSRGFRHYRKVNFIKDLSLFIVSDKVKPSDSFEHSYTQNWHTPAVDSAENVIVAETGEGRTNHVSGTNLIILQNEPETMESKIMKGYSNALQNGTTKYFCYEKYQAGDVFYNTVLIPVKEGDDISAKVDNIDIGTDSTVATAMEITVLKNDNEDNKILYYNSNEYDEDGKAQPTARDFAEYHTNGTNVIITTDLDGVIKNIMFCVGDELTKNSESLIKSTKTLSGLYISYEDNTAVLRCSDEELSDCAIEFYAPERIGCVTLNGTEVDFVRNGNTLTINTDNKIEDEPEEPKLPGSGSSSPSINDFKPGGGSFGGSGGGSGGGSATKPEKEEEKEEDITVDEKVEEEKIKVSFSDVKGHWAENEIISLAEKGIIKGVSENSFQPERSITRAEFAALIVRILGLSDGERAKEFIDVDSDAWYANDIYIASNAGLINGSNGYLRPNDKISREEAAVIISRIFENKDAVSEAQFADFNECSEWAKDSINFVVQDGIMKGVDENSFSPKTYVSRAQSATMIWRILDKIELKEEKNNESTK